MGGHPIPVNDLNEVARGEGLTFQCVQHEKTTDCAFYVAHSYRFCRHRATGQHEGERPEPSTWYQEPLYQDTPFCESRLCICFLKYLLAYAGGSPPPHSRPSCHSVNATTPLPETSGLIASTQWHHLCRLSGGNYW